MLVYRQFDSVLRRTCKQGLKASEIEEACQQGDRDQLELYINVI
jgi:hypothetical protein